MRRFESFVACYDINLFKLHDVGVSRQQPVVEDLTLRRA